MNIYICGDYIMELVKTIACKTVIKVDGGYFEESIMRVLQFYFCVQGECMYVCGKQAVCMLLCVCIICLLRYRNLLCVYYMYHTI